MKIKICLTMGVVLMPCNYGVTGNVSMLTRQETRKKDCFNKRVEQEKTKEKQQNK